MAPGEVEETIRGSHGVGAFNALRGGAAHGRLSWGQCPDSGNSRGAGLGVELPPEQLTDQAMVSVLKKN